MYQYRISIIGVDHAERVNAGTGRTQLPDRHTRRTGSTTHDSLVDARDPAVPHVEPEFHRVPFLKGKGTRFVTLVACWYASLHIFSYEAAGT